MQTQFTKCVWNICWKNDQNCCNASSNLNRPLELNELEQSIRLKRLFIWSVQQSRCLRSVNHRIQRSTPFYNNYDNSRVMKLSILAIVKCTVKIRSHKLANGFHCQLQFTDIFTAGERVYVSEWAEVAMGKSFQRQPDHRCDVQPSKTAFC